MADYETLLNDAYKKIKPITEAKERFEIPRINSAIEGNKTIIINFTQISSYLRRSPEHLQKYLLKELAAAGKRQGDRLVLNRIVPYSKILEKVNQYTKDYVICRECGKPDTEIIKDGKFAFIHCLACGAKHSVARI